MFSIQIAFTGTDIARTYEIPTYTKDDAIQVAARKLMNETKQSGPMEVRGCKRVSYIIR